MSGSQSKLRYAIQRDPVPYVLTLQCELAKGADEPLYDQADSGYHESIRDATLSTVPGQQQRGRPETRDKDLARQRDPRNMSQASTLASSRASSRTPMPKQVQHTPLPVQGYDQYGQPTKQSRPSERKELGQQQQRHGIRQPPPAARRHAPSRSTRPR